MKNKKLKKIRITKKLKNNNWFFDYYPKKQLIIMEIEFKTKKDANNFKEKLNEITKIKKYSNISLAN